MTVAEFIQQLRLMPAHAPVLTTEVWQDGTVKLWEAEPRVILARVKHHGPQHFEYEEATDGDTQAVLIG